MKRHPFGFVISNTIAAIGLIFGTGCASIIHGGNRNVTVASNPAGAKVTISKTSGEMVHSGSTPLTVSLSPKGSYFSGQRYNVKLELPGYRTAYAAITPEMSGWYWGNLVFGGLLGLLVIDPLTGAMWNLVPERIEQTLTPIQAATINARDGFVVVLLSETTPGERVNLVRVN
jgi:hypothetical protein